VLFVKLKAVVDCCYSVWRPIWSGWASLFWWECHFSSATTSEC